MRGLEMLLVVQDAGAGFDVEAARQNGGLGLVSMQERIHLVQGQLFVQSKSGKGTRVVARVPVPAENEEPSNASGEKQALRASAGRA